MIPDITVCRKGEEVYLKLMGNFNTASSTELLRALKKLVMASLEFSPPDAKVSFTFTAHGKVDLGLREQLAHRSENCPRPWVNGGPGWTREVGDR